jgi:hypothetical protein
MNNIIRSQKVDINENSTIHENNNVVKYIVKNNPEITYFKNISRRSTNFFSIPKIISNNNNIILNNNDGDIINNLIISISKNGIIDNLEQIKINVNYGELDILTLNLFDIINISKMFPKYKLLIEEDNKKTYFININILLNLYNFNLKHIIKINITGIDNDIHSEVFYNLFILSSIELARCDAMLLTYEKYYINKYIIIDCVHNEKIYLPLKIVINKLLVEGDYIHNIIYKDDDVEFELINNNSTYNKYHKLCNTDTNCYFYVHSPFNTDENREANKLCSSHGTIIIDGYKNMSSKLYIQCVDLMIKKENTMKMSYISEENENFILTPPYFA